MNALPIQRLTTDEAFDACVRLQQETWQYSAEELFPRRAFLLADRIGGHVLGVYDGAALVAFNVAYPGFRDGVSFLHSQLLAVLPGYRDRGLGRALKLRQREIALAQGIDLVQWTYDPLEIKNAFFNIERLGVVSRQYVRDFYGSSASPLQGGLPTDRLIAEWWVRSDRVARVLAGNAEPQPDGLRVEVPAGIYEWKRLTDARARETQQRVRLELEAAFARDLVVRGYARDGDGSGAFLLTNAADQVPA